MKKKTRKTFKIMPDNKVYLNGEHVGFCMGIVAANDGDPNVTRIDFTPVKIQDRDEPLANRIFKYDKLISEVRDELDKAIGNYPAFNSAHEGFAVLKEEIDELWDEVKRKQSNVDRKPLMRKEAIQVAAMALRFLNDCT